MNENSDMNETPRMKEFLGKINPPEGSRDYNLSKIRETTNPNEYPNKYIDALAKIIESLHKSSSVTTDKIKNFDVNIKNTLLEVAYSENRTRHQFRIDLSKNNLFDLNTYQTLSEDVIVKNYINYDSFPEY